jgi:hypothetical protein
MYSELRERLGLADHQAVLTSAHPKPPIIRSRETLCLQACSESAVVVAAAVAAATSSFYR